MSNRIARHLSVVAAEVLDEDPVLVITGARQAGKTTLARALIESRGGTYLSLDEPDVLRAALADPSALLEEPEPIVLDEFQRAPDVLLSVKANVDRRRSPGRFILTGSTRFLTLPSISESLAGRVTILELWPFSHGELEGKRERFVDRLFSGDPDAVWPTKRAKTRVDYLALACLGGFPVAVGRPVPRSRARWFEGYVTTVTQRDVLELTRLRRVTDLVRTLRLAAARTATVLNVSAFARDAGDLPTSTVTEYLALLESVFLVHRVPAWSTNLSAKVAKHPKLHMSDTGLGAHLLGLGASGVAVSRSLAAGPLLETFVINELKKQLGWAESGPSLFHFRDRSGAEVDAVLETRDGRVAAIEVKAGVRVDAADLRGLELMRDRLGDRFVAGVVLYIGDMPQRRGDKLMVLPIDTLWR